MERLRIESTTPRGRPRSRVAHQAILDAAIALTREVGYDAVTMEGIAARAGVGKATVYRYWSVPELVIAEALQQIVRGITPPDTGTATGDLQVLLRATARMYQDPATGPLLSGLVAAMARSAPIAHAVRTGFVAAWQDAVRAALEQGVARGELRPDLDRELAVALLGGPLAYRFLIAGEPITDSLAHAVAAAVVAAFAPCPRW